MTTAQAQTAERTPVVGYLTKRFPRLSETFILDEILGLEAAGVPLSLFAIADPGEAIVQPDVSCVASTIGYLHSGRGRWTAVHDYLRFLRSHLTLLRRRPLRWCGVVGHIALARRHVSTFKHFLEAGTLAVELDRAGAVHIHAAFAHGPASIVHFVHLLTDLPFSFAAHAKDLYVSSPDILARKVAASSFVLVCSSSAATELTRLVKIHRDPTVRTHAGKIILAPHGVNTERFTPNPAPGTDPGSRPLRILAVGRLVPKKGFPVLLEALVDLEAAGVDFDCRVVGGGDLRSELSDLAMELGLSDSVSFLGALAQPEIVVQYRWAEVFVQASVIMADGDRDGIPNAVLEAMASGLPVVASAVAGIPEVVRNGTTGLLVTPGDSAALATALRRLAENPALLRERLGTEARSYVVGRFSRRACIKPVAALLHGTLDRAPTSQTVGAAGVA
ncbi:MAG: glycosyltransferase family 4 protein [Acidimicrobiales bacterium]